jgi:hypothetical protein
MGILVLLLVKFTINFIEKNNFGNATITLMVHLTPKTKVYQHALI